jgi:hypothetical protein
MRQLGVLGDGQSGPFACKKNRVGLETCLPTHLIAIVGKRSVDGDVLGQPQSEYTLIRCVQIPHARFNSGTSTSWRAQEPPNGRLLAHVVDFGGRGQVTGDVVTSGVDFVNEGGKNTSRATKDGYP